MVRDMPGWLNFICISIIYYFALYIFVDLPFFNREILSQQRWMFSLFYGGAYMSKWRYVNGSWGFNGNLVDWIKKFLFGGGL
jgi:hypothetical protein